MNEHNDILNDPRLTAYIVGELTGDERREIEQLIESDAKTQAAADELRATADLLRDELAGEPCPAMTDEQRQRITQREPDRVVEVKTFQFRRYWMAAGLAAAAMVTLALFIIPDMRRSPGDGMVALGKADDSKKEKTITDLMRSDNGRLREQERVTASADEFRSKGPTATTQSASAPSNEPSAVGGVAAPQIFSRTERAAVTTEAAESLAFRDARERTSGERSTDSKAGSGRKAPEADYVARYATARESTLPTEDTAKGDQARKFEPPRPSDEGKSTPPSTQVPVRTAGGIESTAAVVQNISAAVGTPDGLQTWAAFIDFDESGDASDMAGRIRYIGEGYAQITENPFIVPIGSDAVSTFSVDVDTASYSNMRRFIMKQNQLPPANAIRIEELINYFRYDDPAPAPGEDHAAPFAARMELGTCPWNPNHQLVRIGLKGREIKMENRPATNLVFLIDVSGSMKPADKLPLVKESLKLLLNQLHEDDKLAIVTYAGNAAVALPSTYCSDKAAIIAAIDNLQAGGSTHGSAGIQTAYTIATEQYIQGGVNRVILATDGDFNVGISEESGLQQFIEEKRKSGVFLSVLGFGTGNLQNAKMEVLADKGNGAYAYIDSIREGRKVLVEQATSTLITIAKDVKLQVEFNPALVASYRLIGYENRMLAREDFNDDTRDAGEIGAGHAVTALYEIVPVGAAPGIEPADRDAMIAELQKQIDAIQETLTRVELTAEASAELNARLRHFRAKKAALEAPAAPAAGVDPLKYQKAAEVRADAGESGEVLTLKLRYKQPEGSESRLMEFTLSDEAAAMDDTSADFRFAAAVASFGMVLRSSQHRGNATLDSIEQLAAAAVNERPDEYRTEFLDIVRTARSLLSK